MIPMGPHWSAPKRNNDKAWKRIEQGYIYWNRRRADKGGASGLMGTTINLTQVSKGQHRWMHDNSTYDMRSKWFLQELARSR